MHEHYYVDVDNADTAYKQFCSKFEDIATIQAGRGVLATGETGVGKTSLLNRCVAQLIRLTRNDFELQISVVDLRDRLSRSDSSIERAKVLRRRLLRYLQKEGVFNEDRVGELAEIEDLGEFMEVVSEDLQEDEEAKKVLIVLLPHLERREYCKHVLEAFLKNHVIAMTETSDLDVVDYCERQLGDFAAVPVIRLRLGEISHNDARVFITSRLERARERQVQFPELDQDALDLLLEQRFAGRPPTVKELYVLVRAAFDSAIKNQRDRVLFQDYTALMVSRGLPR